MSIETNNWNVETYRNKFENYNVVFCFLEESTGLVNLKYLEIFVKIRLLIQLRTVNRNY